jgi:hypothetical protein
VSGSGAQRRIRLPACHNDIRCFGPKPGGRCFSQGRARWSKSRKRQVIVGLIKTKDGGANEKIAMRTTIAPIGMTFPTAKNVALPVLLIEDEPAVADYVRTALERNGYAVVCSTSGADGVRLLGTGEYLGVISDMHTPGGLDGAQVHA